MRRWGVAAVLVYLLSATAFAFPLTVLYTNDLHVRTKRLGSIEALVAQERAVGDPVLLFDAGDTWQDSRGPLPMVWGAARMVTWMNRVGYSAMVLGNHDLYLNPTTLAASIASAEFPILCANYVALEDPGWAPATLIEVEGARILVVGLVTHDLLPYGARPRLRFDDPAIKLRALRTEHQGEYDFLFVLAHISVRRAMQIAEAVPEIDLFISGHSHERTEEPVLVGETMIVQSGEFAKHVGRLRLDANPEAGKLSFVDNTLLATETTPADIRSGVAQIILTAISILGFAALLLL